MEEFKSIPGFEGRYEASNKGRLRDSRGNILKQTPASSGHLTVNLNNGERRKSYLVHRIIAETFFGFSNLVIDHVDGNPANNSIENLEYVTVRENTRRWAQQNVRKHTGVHRKKDKWGAQIWFRGKNRFLGSYKTKKEAHNAYCQAFLKIETTGELL